jgi:quinol monooxygenase YgiN
MPKDVYTEYTALPGHEKCVTRILRELALEAQTDPGILLFLTFKHAQEPRKYFILERHMNALVFEAHITSEVRQKYVADLSKHLEDHSPTMTHLAAFP